MTKQQKQRILIVLTLALAAMILARHLLLRSGLSASTDRDGEIAAMPQRMAAFDTAAFSVVAPSLPRGARTRLLESLRAHLEGGATLEIAEGPGESGQRVVLIGLTRARQTALVTQGRGPSLKYAVEEAAAALLSLATLQELQSGRLKVHVAVSGGEREIFGDGGRLSLDGGAEGLWLPEPDLLLLPEEILSRRLVSSEGELSWRRLRDYLANGGRGPLSVDKTPARDGAAYFRVRFDSFMEGLDGPPLRLYRGNDRAPELSPRALLATARSGGDYLLRHQKADGSFAYSYEPKKDAFNDSYNLLRHAGTCYALIELYQATRDPRYLEASRRGIAKLLTFARPPKAEDAAAEFEAIVSPGEEAKLGGAALAILAIVQHQRATGDDRWSARASALARFLLHQQEESGHFHSKYFYGAPDPEPFESIYYPGEAILALTRLYGQSLRPEWLAVAQRGADWLMEVRDAGKSTADLPHDHWLLMGLNELHAVTGEERYAAHAERIAQAIVAAQRTSSDRLDWIGSFYDPPRSTPTATRAEALVAMHRLAQRRGADTRPYLEALLRMAAFQRRCQLTTENALHLPRPDLAVGGFRRSLTDWEVRIDYVQHNVSALLGLRSILLP